LAEFGEEGTIVAVTSPQEAPETPDADADDVEDVELDEAPRPRRQFGTLVLALAIVLGLVLGSAIGLLIPSLRDPGNTSPEAGFARDMKTHHAQAVEMAMIAYQRATDPDVRNLGLDIALTQQNQIGQMDAWLQNWGLGPTGPDPAMAWMPEGTRALVDGRMPGMATDAEMTQLRQATGKDVDAIFLRLMKQHHLGGIHMAEGILAETHNSQVKRLAQAMKDGQQYELKVLTDLQTSLHVS
jgi:uncharacterized protein (DUF305 family)